MIENISVPKKKDNDFGLYFDGSGYWFYVSSKVVWNSTLELLKDMEKEDRYATADEDNCDE